MIRISPKSIKVGFLQIDEWLLYCGNSKFMQRFAAKQLDSSGEPLYYLVEYEVDEHHGVFTYKGRALVTNDINKQLTDKD
jgi:hypothetical protein